MQVAKSCSWKNYVSFFRFVIILSFGVIVREVAVRNFQILLQGSKVRIFDTASIETNLSVQFDGFLKLRRK